MFFHKFLYLEKWVPFFSLFFTKTFQNNQLTETFYVKDVQGGECETDVLR